MKDDALHPAGGRWRRMGPHPAAPAGCVTGAAQDTNSLQLFRRVRTWEPIGSTQLFFFFKVAANVGWRCPSVRPYKCAHCGLLRQPHTHTLSGGSLQTTPAGLPKCLPQQLHKKGTLRSHSFPSSPTPLKINTRKLVGHRPHLSRKSSGCARLCPSCQCVRVCVIYVSVCTYVLEHMENKTGTGRR